MKTTKKSKASRKLLPAIAMLAMSATMLATSTYAWFSMNKTVTATGMELTAKSNNTYLLIHATQTTASDIQSAGLKEAEVDVDEEVFPSSPALTETEVGYLTDAGKTVSGTAITTEGELVEDADTAVVVTNWFTANALAPNAAAIDTATARQLEEFDEYAVIQNFYLTVAAGSDTAYNLTVTPTIAQAGAGDDEDAVKFLIVTSDGGYAAISNANNGTAVDISGDNTGLTDSTVITATLYIYYDGDETPVYTNHKSSLTGATIDLQFDVDTVAP